MITVNILQQLFKWTHVSNHPWGVFGCCGFEAWNLALRAKLKKLRRSYRILYMYFIWLLWVLTWYFWEKINDVNWEKFRIVKAGTTWPHNVSSLVADASGAKWSAKFSRPLNFFVLSHSQNIRKSFSSFKSQHVLQLKMCRWVTRLISLNSSPIAHKQ